MSGTPLRLRLPQAMKDELTAAATKAGVTPSDFIRSAIQRELNRRRHPAATPGDPVGRTVVNVEPSPPPVAHVVVVERRGGQLRAW